MQPHRKNDEAATWDVHPIASQTTLSGQSRPNSYSSRFLVKAFKICWRHPDIGLQHQNRNMQCRQLFEASAFCAVDSMLTFGALTPHISANSFVAGIPIAHRSSSPNMHRLCLRLHLGAGCSMEQTSQHNPDIENTVCIHGTAGQSWL